ncbi:RsbR, positive regulator of sigma-B [Labilithrix luteola]|uniref:RsbR, positive regulator of sigma-B n=1 Tax=Labilithrix luteola TaxID=1391654 RepID=A0A0K1Q0B9_9BACT|nr:STAS domain-containing protein [Labilithrix luteola]AKU99096.1 RsbR, positive regulator of sigma-B [Labilithrix luteola]
MNQATSETSNELLTLQGRINELERQLAEVTAERDVFKHVVQNAPAVLSRITPEGDMIYANTACEQVIGMSSDQVRGTKILPLLYPGELWAQVEEYFRIAGSGGDVRDYEMTIRTHAGEDRTLAWNSYNRFGPDGVLVEVVSFGVDVTERLRGEADRKRLQDEVIEMQAATLAELSTPLIPISNDIIAMPLIGAIDGARADRIMETLLAGVIETRSRTAIIDITGVATVDTKVADALIRAARAVHLVGADVVLTGIRPEVAQTLVGLGTNFDGITTRANLQSAIAFAMRGERSGHADPRSSL